MDVIGQYKPQAFGITDIIHGYFLCNVVVHAMGLANIYLVVVFVLIFEIMWMYHAI